MKINFELSYNVINEYTIVIGCLYFYINNTIFPIHSIRLQDISFFFVAKVNWYPKSMFVIVFPVNSLYTWVDKTLHYYTKKVKTFLRVFQHEYIDFSSYFSLEYTCIWYIFLKIVYVRKGLLVYYR